MYVHRPPMKARGFAVFMHHRRIEKSAPPERRTEMRGPVFSNAARGCLTKPRVNLRVVLRLPSRARRYKREMPPAAPPSPPDGAAGGGSITAAEAWVGAVACVGRAEVVMAVRPPPAAGAGETPAFRSCCPF